MFVCYNKYRFSRNTIGNKSLVQRLFRLSKSGRVGSIDNINYTVDLSAIIKI